MRRQNITTQLNAALMIVGLAFGPACATTGPSDELVDARKAYERAQNSKAAELEPDELVDAREALQAAEKAHDEDPGSAEEQHLAYLAERRAQLAFARGQRAAYNKEYSEKRQQLVSQAKNYAYTTQDQLSEAQRALQQKSGEIQQTKQELAEEREARKKAEQMAAKALQDLKDVAMVKEESRGYVITLSGSVLFPSGKSELLQTARQRLSQVADALKQQHEDSHIIVEGHTDSRGSDSYNQQLSLDRAQSVRSYLVSRGIPEQRIDAKGMGESEPIADNSTPEGRANNRRVEIIVEPTPASGGAQQQTSAAQQSGSGAATGTGTATAQGQ